MLTDFLITAAFVFGVAAGELRNRLHPNHGTPREICQCEHGSAFHDATGCHFVIERGTATRYTFGKPDQWEPAPCACVRYVGPLSSYVPELDGAPAPEPRP